MPAGLLGTGKRSIVRHQASPGLSASGPDMPDCPLACAVQQLSDVGVLHQVVRLTARVRVGAVGHVHLLREHRHHTLYVTLRQNQLRQNRRQLGNRAEYMTSFEMNRSFGRNCHLLGNRAEYMTSFVMNITTLTTSQYTITHIVHKFQNSENSY